MIFDVNDKLFGYISLSPTSPSGLVWSKSRVRADGRPISGASAGKECGSIDTKGYWMLKFEGRKYRVHNIIFRIHNDFIKIPKGYVIDHLDGNTLNNHIENLRMISLADNTRNLAFKGNSSGIRGVVYFNNGKVERFSAIWTDECGKERRKSYSVFKHGYDNAKALAKNARQSAIDRLCLLGFNYTDRHSILVE